MKVYWRFDGKNYSFKFILQDILVVSGSQWKAKGNKRKSGEISASRIFMISTLHHSSTGKLINKPDLTLFGQYFNSFRISEKDILKWVNNNLKYKWCDNWLLWELREKIKDNL